MGAKRLFTYTVVGVATAAMATMLTLSAVTGITPFAPASPADAQASSDGIAEEKMLSVLYYKDRRIGAVESNFEEAQLLERAGTLLGANYEIEKALQLCSENGNEKPLTADECVQALVLAVKKDYTLAKGLYAGDRLIAAAKEESVLREALEKFLTAFSQLKNEAGNACLKDLTVRNCILKKDFLLDMEEVEAVLAVCCSEKMQFEVDEDKIAEYLDGNDMPSLVPVFVEEREETVEEIVDFETEILRDDSLYEGQRLTVSKGEAGVKALTYCVVYEDGREVSRKLVAQTILVPAVNEVVREGVLPNGSATGSFIWTTAEGYISSLYGYRDLFNKVSLHAGIDIAVPTGTALYAGDGGTVIRAGESGSGYGTYVVIDHGNGIVTYYGHMSKVAVCVGDKVNKGEFIGYSGATGRVTGPHVHYEFRVNGVSVNPKKYLPER